jgi:hypothetical protein
LKNMSTNLEQRLLLKVSSNLGLKEYMICRTLHKLNIYFLVY